MGSYLDSSGDAQTLAERWNGTTWSLSTTADLAGTTGGQLLGVSCVSSASCLAAGFNVLADGDQSTLAEKLSGSSWAITPTPDASGAFYDVLSGVACPSATSCTAAGYTVGGSGDTTQLEAWNGTKWSLVTSGALAGDYSTGLNAVACMSTTFCVAAGSALTGSAETMPSSNRTDKPASPGRRPAARWRRDGAP